MKEFQTIYRILKILQKSMDLEEFDNASLSASRLGLSEPKWCRIMTMLADEGYVSGIEAWQTIDQTYPSVLLTRPEITLKGLEYLESNGLMRKAAEIARGVMDIVT